MINPNTNYVERTADCTNFSSQIAGTGEIFHKDVGSISSGK